MQLNLMHLASPRLAADLARVRRAAEGDIPDDDAAERSRERLALSAMFGDEPEDEPEQPATMPAVPMTADEYHDRERRVAIYAMRFAAGCDINHPRDGAELSE